MRGLDILINPWCTLSIEHRRLWWHWLPPAHGLMLSLLIDAEDALKHNEANPKQNGKECDPLHRRLFNHRTEQQCRQHQILKESKRLHSTQKRHNSTTLPVSILPKTQKKAELQVLSTLQSRLDFSAATITAADRLRRRWCSPDVPLLWHSDSAAQAQSRPRFSVSRRCRPSHRCRHPATCGSRPPWSGTHGG